MDLASDEGIIGVTTATEEEFLLEDKHNDDFDNGSEERSEGDEGEATGDVHETTTPGAGTDELDMDQVFTAGVEAIHQGKVNAKHLATIWRISHDDATRTIDATSQHSVRSEDPTLSQNYGTNDHMLQYRRIKDYFFMDTFFATSKGGKSSCGNTCCQLFVTDKEFLYVVPMKRKSEVMQAVKQFAKEVGAPDAIMCDMASKQTSAEVEQFCNTIGTTLQALEEGTPWANKAELYIKLMKEAVWKDMWVANSPLPFWDYCLECRARIYNMTACDNLEIRGTNPHTATLCVEGDISNLCQYSWYNWCYYQDHTAKFPHNQEVLGRVLGAAHGEGNEMAQWVLKANGNMVPRHSFRPLQTAKIYSDSEKKKRELFDKLIYERYGDSINVVLPKSNKLETERYEDEDEPAKPIPDIEETVDANGHPLNQLPAYDRLLHAEVQLQHDDWVTTGKVKHQASGLDGNMVGKYDNNPMLNSIMYEVEFADRTVKEYGANIIAEDML